MKINNKELRQRILDYNAKTITDRECEQLWDDLREICAYQIKKSKNDKAYYDFIQDMVIYILDHYIENFEVMNEEGKENSALAFLLQSAYWSKLVMWNNKYKHESNEFMTMNTASADSDGNSTEMVNTWSNEAYSEMWAHAWGKSLPIDPNAKVKKKKKKKEKGIYDENGKEVDVEIEVEEDDKS